MPKVYIKLRIQLEQLLEHYDNVLNLRVIYPITEDLDDKRGLLGKLAGFSAVDNSSSCCTFLEDLCPLVPELMKRKATGPLNFTNPGLVSYGKVVEYLKQKNPDYDPELRPPGGRPAISLDSSRMVELCEGLEVPTAEQSLDRIFRK